MKGGFGAGLFQGALVCGAALVVLSLVMPQPPRPAPMSVPGAAAPKGDALKAAVPMVAAAPGDAPANAPPPDQAAARPPAADAGVADAPSADAGVANTPSAAPIDSLPMPADSEFARGSDLQPVAPAPLGEVALRDAAVPVVTLPGDLAAAEAAPVPADPATLPEARGDAPTAPEIAPPVAEPINLPAPAQEAPIPVPPPGLVVTPGLDLVPDAFATQSPVAPHQSAPQQSEPQLSIAAATADAPITLPDAALADDAGPQPRATPISAPGSGFNLSVPPDFSALLSEPD